MEEEITYHLPDGALSILKPLNMEQSLAFLYSASNLFQEDNVYDLFRDQFPGHDLSSTRKEVNKRAGHLKSSVVYTYTVQPKKQKRSSYLQIYRRGAKNMKKAQAQVNDQAAPIILYVAFFWALYLILLLTQAWYMKCRGAVAKSKSQYRNMQQLIRKSSNHTATVGGIKPASLPSVAAGS